MLLQSNREVEIMKKYEKPIINVIELQLKENIAAVPTTVYKGSSKATASSTLVNMALSEGGTGLAISEGLVS